jgi:RES domain
MSIGFRHADARYPFLWESAAQPVGRWHAAGEGPCQYLADTPDGAWAEFIRHEEITDPIDLAGVARSMWAIEVPDDALNTAHRASTPGARDDPDSYASCQRYAAVQRAAGVTEMIAPTAALHRGGAHGERTDGGLRDAADRDGAVWVLFGPRPDLRAWRVVERGTPPERILGLVRRFGVQPGA